MLARAVVGCLVAAIVTAPVCAENANITVTKDGRHVSVPYASTLSIAPPAHDSNLTTIFSNIGTVYPKGLYFCCYADTVSGPTSPFAQNWLAFQFTPAANATISELDAAITYSGTGPNEIMLGLYTDGGGVPATKLAEKLVRGLGSFSSCCSLAVAMFRKAVPVTANTPYWVVATTTKASQDTFAAWNYDSTDQIDHIPIAGNIGSGWQNLGAFAPAPGFAVYGK
jgi:hypothetical protein